MDVVIFVAENKASASKTSSGLTQDDESFLRAILSGRGLTTTTPAPSNEISNAALLAALLKAQGIEPPTPATKIREQLQLAVSIVHIETTDCCIRFNPRPVR